MTVMVTTEEDTAEGMEVTTMVMAKATTKVTVVEVDTVSFDSSKKL